MNRLDPILVTVDFSETAAETLRFAGETAQCRNMPLVVLHVVHGSVADAGGYQVPQSAHPVTDMQVIAREKLQKLVDEVVERNPNLRGTLLGARTVLVGGVPASRILEVAEREGAEMIVMASHGRHGLVRAAMGSVAETVTRKSRVPVTIVKDERSSHVEHPVLETRADERMFRSASH